MLIPFVLAAFLGVPDVDFASTPTAPEALVAQETSPVGSGSACGGVATEAPSRRSVPALATLPKGALLVEAQVLEKYRSFRESLTTP